MSHSHGVSVAEAIKALTDLCDEIACEEQHGDGADDADCKTCQAHKRARKLIRRHNALSEKVKDNG